MPLLQRCATLLDRPVFHAAWRALRRALYAGQLVLSGVCLPALLWLFVGLLAATGFGRSQWVPTSTQWLILALVASSGLFVYWLLLGWTLHLLRRNTARAAQLDRRREGFLVLRQRLIREEFLFDPPPED